MADRSEHASHELSADAVGFDHVGLSVGDLDRQRRFYAETFGFAQEHYAEIDGGRVRIASLRAPGGPAVELTERRGSAPQRFTDPYDGAGTQGYFHWALAVTDLDTAVIAVVAGGGDIVTRPADASRPGVRFAYVADPEGNLIELVSLPVQGVGTESAGDVSR